MPEFNAGLFNAQVFGGGGQPPGPVIQAGPGLLYPALRKAGVTLGPQRTPSVAQYQDAIDELNRLIGSLNCDRLFIYSIANYAFPLTGKKTYTIGISPDPSFSADFAVPRPQAIDAANIISGAPGASLRYPLTIMTDLQWAKIGLQDIPSTIPDVLYNDRAYPLSTLYLYGQPMPGYQLELFVWNLVPGFLTPADVVLLPPGYEDALVLNLAVRLAPHFQLQVSADVRADAQKALMRLESINAPQPIAEVGFGCRGNYDVYSDRNR
jgi:hypothetical protein